jgi:hypothetical protein
MDMRSAVSAVVILAMLTLLPVRTRLIHPGGSSWLVGAARGTQNGGYARR